MSTHTAAESSRSSSADWADAESRDALELIAAGITELAGFEVAAITVARGDDDFEVVAVAGSDAARAELLGTRSSRRDMLAELELADDWGTFKFVPHERLGEAIQTTGWIPDIVPLDVPDAWHPLDMLLAPLYDRDGVMRGFLSIDVPSDGLRPGPAQRRVLDRYAEQAGRAVITALDRAVLAEQLRMASAARDVVRRASRELTLDRLLVECQTALVTGFRTAGMWIHTFDETGASHGAIYSADGTHVEIPASLVRIAQRSADRAWSAQRVDVVSRAETRGSQVTPAQADEILTYLESIGIASILFVPIGSGPECLGCLVLTRVLDGPAWSEAEQQVALDVGHDLGRAIINARAYEHERALVRELQALDTYKSSLVATLSHELKTPLTSILGNLELLEHDADVSDDVRRGLAAVHRGAHRLVRVTDDLLLLAKVGDPTHPLVAVPVPLRRVVDEVLAMTAVAAQQRDLSVVVEAIGEPVVARGDAGELDVVVANLVSNAVKYTPEGRTITVTLVARAHEVELSVSDEGIGISEHDLGQLFREFFRSSNPLALSQPGTGLGLAIVDRIVTRHQGRVEVESTLGVGSTFRVLLPAG